MANGALPDDIMFCILSRLPVKCLLRFKSVCRSWRKLFATPEFIKLHLEQFSSDPENEAFIIYDLSKPIMSLSSIEPNVEKPTVLDLPVRANFCQGAYYVGSCNGLVCICFPKFDFSRVIAFWNPTLRLSKFVQLPKEDDRNTSFGFGYDAKEDHYIVVQIIYSYRNFGRIEGVEVYYAQSVSSETVKVGFDCSLQSEWGVTVNRNPYWVAKVDQNVCLVYCDVTNLEFKMLPLPAPIVDAKYVVAFVEWKGSLAALVPPKYRGRTSIDVWIFDDFDMIWRKNHTFRPSVVLPNMSVYRCFQYSKNGKILFESHRYKKLYVLDAGTGWVEEIETVHPYHNVCGYSESLAYIEGMENDPVVAPARGSQFSARRFAGVISNLLRKAVTIIPHRFHMKVWKGI